MHLFRKKDFVWFSRYKKFSWSLFLSVIFLVMLMDSCEDDPTQVGLELKSVLGRVQPVCIDTISVFTSVESMDSIRTDHFDYAFLGNFRDPVFGWTDASFASQYRLSQPWSPGHNADVDSVKLFLVVDRYNGNETTLQTVNVYELYKTLFYDSLYYSNFNVKDSISEWPVGSATFHPGDTMIVVYLSKTFGRKIIRDTAVLKNQDLFLSHFKGFYINTDKTSGSNEGGFIRIHLLTAESYLAIYYHNDLNSQAVYPLYINSYSARVNIFEHKYDEAPAETRIRYLNQGKEDSVMYVQGLGGVYTRMDIPGMKPFRDSSIILNSVKLFLPVDTILPTPIQKPSGLSVMIRKDGTLYHIFDVNLPEFYDGSLNKEEGIYKIGLTKHFQDYLLGRNNYTTFYLVVNDFRVNSERVVLKSRLNSQPLKLEVIYSRK